MAGLDGLAFLRHASEAGLVQGVILSSAVEPSLRRATLDMIRCLDLDCLGDLGKPFDIERAARFLGTYRPRPATPHEVQDSVAPPSPEEIREGLGKGEFEAYFQPKVSMSNQQLEGAEVLARWRHPRRGVLPPSQFLPQMQAHGLIDALFWQLLGQGLDLQRELEHQGRKLNLAFNIQAEQLAPFDFAERISAALDQAGLPGEGLTFELTETGLLQAPASSLETLVRLRLLGCGLAMDDYGAGYSSLDRLCELPFSQLKLDANFVRRLESQPRSSTILGNTVALSQALGLSLVVEGVETEAQRSRLLALGCEVAQGFLFARPLDGEAFRAMLAAGDPLPPH
ncbi:EAL domain protein [compost metagenome]